MALFGFLKSKEKDNNENTVNNTGNIEGVSLIKLGVSLSKGEETLEKMSDSSHGVVDLKKHSVNLNKKVVSLSKEKNIDLMAHKARVGVALDYSGSMSSRYRSGAVQDALNRLFPLSLRFDDNGELEVWTFETRFNRREEMTLDNFSDYIKTKITGNMGGTSYAPVLKDILKKYFVESPDDTPVFIIFITDGDNGDHKETDEIIRESAKENIFIQFVGIGNDSMSYLSKLDDLDGRECDNTGFIKIADFDKVDDDYLYSKLLEQYIDWLKVKGF